jgi:biopolymer transport protein ExbB
MRRVLFFSMLCMGSCLFADAKEPSFIQNVEKKVITIDLKNAFNASPIIYSILLGLSVASMTVALNAFFEINRKMKIDQSSLKEAQEKLITCKYDEAIACLEHHTDACAHMVKTLIETRNLGFSVMREAMKDSGKRQTLKSWQKLSLLSDIALLAPMIGLLGTVLGMFYAFYDVNRSIESLASLFDGLGVSVGTTVAGLLVALVSMGFQTALKHRLISKVDHVEAACEKISIYIGPR